MNKKTALELVKMPLEDLMTAADEIRKKNRTAHIELCAIVNAKSGLCSEDCRFCAQAACHNTGVKTYALMKEEDILEGARVGRSYGAERVGIVTSGKSPDDREVESIASAMRRFPEVGVQPCASLGEINRKSLYILKSSGLKRYHHNIETSENFYSKIVTTHSYKDRVGTIVSIKSSGMEICSGGIIGLGETWEDRIDMALALKELEVDSVPLNFLVPIQGTPLAEMPAISAFEALRTVAIFRMILEKQVLRVAAGREAVLKNMQKMIFKAGADGMMVGSYLTVPGADPETDKCLISETMELWKRQR